MKKLKNYYKILLEAEKVDIPTIIPAPKEDPPDLRSPYWERRFRPYLDTPIDNFDGWDEWDGQGDPPDNWPHIVDPRGRLPRIPMPADPPSDWPNWEEWPPPPGHSYYQRFRGLANILNEELPLWINTPEKLRDWLAGRYYSNGVHLEDMEWLDSVKDWSWMALGIFGLYYSIRQPHPSDAQPPLTPEIRRPGDPDYEDWLENSPYGSMPIFNENIEPPILVSPIDHQDPPAKLDDIQRQERHEELLHRHRQLLRDKENGTTEGLYPWGSTNPLPPPGWYQDPDSKKWFQEFPPHNVQKQRYCFGPGCPSRPTWLNGRWVQIVSPVDGYHDLYYAWNPWDDRWEYIGDPRLNPPPSIDPYLPSNPGGIRGQPSRYH